MASVLSRKLFGIGPRIYLLHNVGMKGARVSGKDRSLNGKQRRLARKASQRARAEKGGW